MDKKGVTLVELVVVLAIIAIGATLMVPNIGSWIPSYRLRSATRDIVSIMRAAQMKAVSNNARYGVAFDTANHQLQLYRDSGGLVADGPATSLPTGITFDSITGLPTDGPGGEPLITFFPNSTASASGNITLKNRKDRQKTVQISMSTGRITIQ
jgi:prepilin-type N-terminal cleavage/methylation domain-containing protein